MKWHQTWNRVLGNAEDGLKAARDEAHRVSGSSRVLMATGTAGFPLGSLVESSLAVALTLRGALVDTLICDGVLPACQQSDFGDLPSVAPLALGLQPRCEKCFTQGDACYRPLGLDVLRYGDYLDAAAREWAHDLASTVALDDMRSFTLDGLRVGEHAHAGALRYFARGDLVAQDDCAPIQRRYFEAALLTVRCLQRVLDSRDYAVACFHHGIYVPQGLVGEVCRSRGVRVVNWNPGYRDRCFVFSHGDSYHHTMLTEPVEVWEQLDLAPSMRTAIEAYLQDRRTGRGDWIWFHPEEGAEAADDIRAIGLDPTRPFATLLTSVIWDAQLHYESNAFESMLAWLFETVRYFRERPDRQLVIRIHPAEISGNIASRQTVEAELAAHCTPLPSNVFVISPASRVSTYNLIESSQAVLVYSTKTGIEIAARGVPVLVAGEAWIRNKGFSMDASSPEEYLRILDSLPRVRPLNEAQRERALKYAYHYYFRRMIPLSFVRSREKFRFDLSLTAVDDLRPGRDRGLDCICEGILDGAPFVFTPRESD